MKSGTRSASRQPRQARPPAVVDVRGHEVSDFEWCRAQVLNLLAAWDVADDGQRSRVLPALFECPGKGKALPLARTDAVLVQSSAAGTWKAIGAVYTSAPTIQLNPGWNLVAARYPNRGLTTDIIFNQIAAESGACSAAILTNQACSPTITEIKTMGAGGQTVD